MEVTGRVWTDETGAVWWQRQGYPAECLADSDSLCGVLLWHTGPDDPFRDCCSDHDHDYSNRAMFEAWGFDREWMDSRFLACMLIKAGDNEQLFVRAYRFHTIVRDIGWIFYYRHPGAPNTESNLAQAYDFFLDII